MVKATPLLGMGRQGEPAVHLFLFLSLTCIRAGAADSFIARARQVPFAKLENTICALTVNTLQVGLLKIPYWSNKAISGPRFARFLPKD